MRILYGNVIGNRRDAHVATGNRVRVGSDPGSDLVLGHQSVAPESVVLHVRNGAWEVVVGGGPVVVGGRKVRAGERVPLTDGQVIVIWPFSLTVELPAAPLPPGDGDRAELDRQQADLLASCHTELLRRMDLAHRGDAPDEKSREHRLSVEREIDDVVRQFGLYTPEKTRLADHLAGTAVRRECLDAVFVSSGADSVWAGAVNAAGRLLTAVAEREKELALTVEKLTNRLQLASVSDQTVQVRRLEERFWGEWAKLSPKLFGDFRNYLAARGAKTDLLDILFGYGPLEDLLRTPTVSEIMVVDRDRIFVEKNGLLENSGRRFLSDEATVSVIERIVILAGRTIDRSAPLVDARLSDGSRVNAVIPPLAVSGPCLTVRKFPTRRPRVSDLIAYGSLTPAAAEVLRAAVLARKNVVVSGGTGSGKTTLLNCLSEYIPDRERIVTIEDTAELQLRKPHVVRLETKPANLEGAGAYTIRDLVKNSLRMRPDRIVVGECRGAEALDMLQAMNTGHDGSMTTLHANSAADAILRLEVLVLMAADLPIASIHRQIASAVDLIVQLHRLRTGRRAVTQITEVVGVDPITGRAITRDLFLAPEQPADAPLAPTGALPTFVPDLLSVGGLRFDIFYS